MNSQEEWGRIWEAAFPTIMVDDPCHSQGISQTMIYTGEEAKGLADQAVVTAEETAKTDEKEPLSEDEKARLWRAVMESCSG